MCEREIEIESVRERERGRKGRRGETRDSLHRSSVHV